MTGESPPTQRLKHDIRAQAETPALMSAVLEHLAADESLLLVFAAGRGIAPDSIGRAIRSLQVPPS